jgi:catechol 2,3-dioxygenase-like lactoylglutathione lyase family enzyme
MSPPLLVFDHVVVGASDVSAAVTFFRLFGLQTLDARAGDWVGVPGTSGVIRVERVDGPPGPAGPYATGGQAIDLYTRDLVASVELVDAAGLDRGPAVEYAFGPLQLGQVMVSGPDGLPVVLVSIDHRLPSALDHEPARLHSQLHSMVWTVTELEEATAFFTDVAGLSLRATFPLAEPAVSEFMQLPRHSPMRMSVLSHPDARPPRFELLAHEAGVAEPDEVGHRPGRPLSAGAMLPVFTTAHLTHAADVLGGTICVDELGSRLDLRSPGGIDMEVRELEAEKVGPFYAHVS